MTPLDRRTFLSSSTLSAGSLAFLGRLPPVAAEDTRPDPKLVRLDSGIEPTVRLIEQTPREKLLEEIGSRIKKSLTYRDVLAALLLAGVRNVPPRPSVGFKFHAVLVVHSAHQASLAGPDSERWLPLFWALDNFKKAQADTQNDQTTRGWRMKPADEMKLPSPHKARAAFQSAVENWDPEAADAATAALVRTAEPGEMFDLFAKYGARDFRDIGHKAIYVAGAFRCLDVIGWHHAEPVLRSLTFALLHHEGENPSKRDGAPDRPGRRNLERVRDAAPPRRNLREQSPELTEEVIQELRTASADEMSDKVMKWTEDGVSPRSVWDGLFLAGGELLMRQPGIVALHSLTSLNALHYAYRTTGDAAIRKFLLLQAAAFVPLFREAMKSRGKIGEAKIDELGAVRPNDPIPVKFDDIFPTLSNDRGRAAQLAAAYLQRETVLGAKALIDEGRRLIFLKGTDSHDYKFSSAVMEDAASISPEWRSRFLAASLYWLKGSGAPDSPLVRRTHAALA